MQVELCVTAPQLELPACQVVHKFTQSKVMTVAEKVLMSLASRHFIPHAIS